ncbi:hypothetical protein FocTR4_00012224 [Fusarium oxysporum f. sp. cubense]|uniref:HAT C-terminal dimerisation domain-containing protein n=1 Tax=Fusarium oxysporum f. sp. cubense TaxID=61366 RepID=A0A5C6SF67_FUSOC|nr:hypothetical protein FocTR4_00012224 [Fusarium oxysporum f. sp. cubense]
MAIDLFSVPAMSSEPERIFSLAGQMVTPPRKRLQADIVGAARCISSWEKSGAIEISKCAQMNSIQIQIESSVSKSNPTRVNLIWIYLLTSLG